MHVVLYRITSVFTKLEEASHFRFVTERQQRKAKSCEYQFYSFWFDSTENRTRVFVNVSVLACLNTFNS